VAQPLCRLSLSVNSYLIHDISAAMTLIRPDLEASFWYFWARPDRALAYLRVLDELCPPPCMASSSTHRMSKPIMDGGRSGYALCAVSNDSAQHM
jgi:hypothetical protein